MSTQAEDFSQFDISPEEKDKLVAEVIRYILFKTEQSNGCPIKREELTQIITGKNYKQRALPSYIIDEAKSKLSTIFGYEMRELQRSRASSANLNSRQVGADAKSYVIISKLPSKIYKKCVVNASTAHLTGFAFVVIGIVNLAGGKITEEDLWHHLRRLGLSETEETHPVFGNVKQALESLVQQRYLMKGKISGPEGFVFNYELAEGSLDELVDQRIKEYVLQIVQKDVNVVDVD